MINRLIAAACICGLVAAGSEAAAAPAAPATPVGNGPAAVGGLFVQPSIDLLRRLGVISGDPGGNMRLGDTITRAELAKIVVAAAGQGDAALRAQAETPSFPDIKGHWARGYVAVARRLGIAGGYADGTFRPGNPVTNAEALTMLLRTAGIQPTGAWPAAYLDAARRAGVLTPALEQALPVTAPALRGVVFLLAERVFTQMEDKDGRNLLQRVYDPAAPRLTVSLENVQGGVTAAADVSLAIQAPGAVMIQVNGRAAWFKDGAFRYRLPLARGQNEIYVLAADEMGNTAFQRLQVERR